MKRCEENTAKKNPDVVGASRVFLRSNRFSYVKKQIRFVFELSEMIISVAQETLLHREMNTGVGNRRDFHT